MIFLIPIIISNIQSFFESINTGRMNTVLFHVNFQLLINAKLAGAYKENNLVEDMLTDAN